MPAHVYVESTGYCRSYFWLHHGAVLCGVAVRFPKAAGEKRPPTGTIKGFIATWLKSIGIAVSAGALLGAVEWVLAKLLNRRLLDGIPAVLTGIGIPALVGSWLIDRCNRLRGAMIAAVATLPRIVVSESWVRDKSSDEEFDQEMKIARDRLYAVLNDDSSRKRVN